MDIFKNVHKLKYEDKFPTKEEANKVYEIMENRKLAEKKKQLFETI